MNMTFPIQLQQQVEQAILEGKLVKGQMVTCDELATVWQTSPDEMRQVLLAEQVKPIASVPAYFIGAGLYFAAYFYWWPTTQPANPQDYVMPLVLVAFSMAVGFCLGWVTIWLYGLWGSYSKKLVEPQAAKESVTTA